MRLRHSYDRSYDLPTQMKQLSRDTTAMLLETLGSIPIIGYGIFNDVQYMTELDWDDKTHTINAEFIPDPESNPVSGAGDRTHLTMSVTDTNKNSSDTKTLTVSVELGHLYTQYHTRYIPIGWKLTIATTTTGDRAVYLVGGQPRNRIDKIREIRITRGVAIATMRSLAIQMGISLAAKNRRLNSDTVNEMRTHGVPESQETSFLKLGMDQLMELVRNAESTNMAD